MPYEKGDEERQEHNHEKRQIGNPGRVPGVRDKNVPNREGLGKTSLDTERPDLARSESGLFFYLGSLFKQLLDLKIYRNNNRRDAT
jgi:hypothetical protein